jgi:hypothetical protein
MNSELHTCRDIEKIMNLIENGADVNCKNIYGETPLMKIIVDSIKYYDELPMFVDNYKKNNYNRTTIEIITILILNNANVYSKDNNGLTIFDIINDYNDFRVDKIKELLNEIIETDAERNRRRNLERIEKSKRIVSFNISLQY